MYSDEEVFNTVNKITNTKSLFSMSGFSTKKSPYKDKRAELFYSLLKGINKEREKAKLKPLTSKRLATALNSNPFLKQSYKGSTEELHTLVDKCTKQGSFKYANWVLFSKKK